MKCKYVFWVVAWYIAFDKIMSEMENEVTDMHQKVNLLNSMYNDIRKALEKVEINEKNFMLETEGKSLLAKIKRWDEQMVQRRSQAYDDVENFENKFTAEYLFLMNQTNSSLPRVTQASFDRKAELDKQWQTLKKTAEELINTKVPAYNKKLWEAGVGAIRTK